MIPARIFRLIHTNGLSNKSLLDKLINKTGYCFASCMKAVELHKNDVEKAKTWLREQARQYSCIQAAKPKGRNTSESLIAMTVDGRHAALAEINCEIDFVAGNTKLRCLAETMVFAVLNYANSQETQNEVQRTVFDADNLKDLLAMDGKPLGDHSILAIGNSGGNINLRRALALSIEAPDVKLFGCTDPAPMNPIPVSFGKYGAVVAIKCKKSDLRDTKLGTYLCEHIIDMKPQTIGNPWEDKLDDEWEEDRLIHQKFIHDPSVYVQDLLTMSNAKIVDFARFEINEDLD